MENDEHQAPAAWPTFDEETAVSITRMPSVWYS